MAALTEDRNTPARAGGEFAYPMAANKTCYAGGIVMLDASGNATPGATATGQIAYPLAGIPGRSTAARTTRCSG